EPARPAQCCAATGAVMCRWPTSASAPQPCIAREEASPMADYEHRWRDDQDRWRRADEWHQQTAHGRHRPDHGSTGYGADGGDGGGGRGEEHGPNYETGYTEPRGGWYGGGGRGQGGYGQGGHGYRGGRSDRGGYGASGGYEGQ